MCIRDRYMGAPKAIPDDGLLDFIIVRKTVGRLKLAGLINAYTVSYTHLDVYKRQA